MEFLADHVSGLLPACGLSSHPAISQIASPPAALQGLERLRFFVVVRLNT